VNAQMPKGRTKNVPELKVLAALERQLRLGLARVALQPQYDLLGGLCLFVEDGLGLTSVTGLLAVVTTLSLGEERGLCGEWDFWLIFCDWAFGGFDAMRWDRG